MGRGATAGTGKKGPLGSKGAKPSGTNQNFAHAGKYKVTDKLLTE